MCLLMKLLLYERLERCVVNDMNGEIERLTGLTLRFVVNKVGGREFFQVV